MGTLLRKNYQQEGITTKYQSIEQLMRMILNGTSV